MIHFFTPSEPFFAGEFADVETLNATSVEVRAGVEDAEEDGVAIKTEDDSPILRGRTNLSPPPITGINFEQHKRRTMLIWVIVYFTE